MAPSDPRSRDKARMVAIAALGTMAEGSQESNRHSHHCPPAPAQAEVLTADVHL